MDKLESLTPEQEKILDEVAAEYIDKFYHPEALDMEVVTRWLDVVYGLYDLKRPERMEIVGSPKAALELATQLTGTQQSEVDSCGVVDASWVARYDAYIRIGRITEEETRTAPEVVHMLALRAFMRCAWDTVLLDECAIVIRHPDVLKVDDDGNLHAADAPCLEWRDGSKYYAWHGTWVNEKVIMTPRSFTREEFLAINNTEQRRALGESAGWDWIVGLLAAEAKDWWRDPVTNLEYVLLVSGPLKFLQKQSPRLKNGSQPTYVEPVHEDLKTAQAARKWQAVPSLTPEQCEADPGLTYGFEA